MLRRVAILGWAIFCLYAAGGATIPMLYSYAPSPGQVPECQSAESHGIERVRRLWGSWVFMAAGLLSSNTVALVALSWPKAGSSPPGHERIG